MFDSLVYSIKFHFSCVRCPPCRRFTPLLVEFYNQHHEEKNFEIIFISADEEEEEYEVYYKDMPWLTLDHKQQEKKEELDEKFDVQGIPKLVLLDADSGDIICTNARDHIQNKDKEGKNFPWKEEKKEEDQEEEKEEEEKKEEKKEEKEKEE